MFYSQLCNRYRKSHQEALKDRGWTMGSRTQAHDASSADDKTMVQQTKFGSSMSVYFRCLLSLHELHQRGLQTLAVRQPQNYYKCLLVGHDHISLVTLSAFLNLANLLRLSPLPTGPPEPVLLFSHVGPKASKSVLYFTW